MVELIICEKPAQAEKVAEAIADKKPLKKTIGKVSYYELKHNNKEIIVACAVGHLFTIAEKNKKAWTYPIFEFEWKPSYEVSKSSKFSKAYFDVIKKLSKTADEFTVACDFDIEGSTIGFNIIRFICGKEDAKRMKFSTLTKDELLSSYEHAMPHLDFPIIESGITRHSLDWLFGINMSRALTLSIKNSGGGFKLLSTGRVQGPALKILADREHEIKAFIPKPFWQIGIKTENNIIAFHKEDKIFDKQRAESIFKKIKDKNARVSKIDKKEFVQDPPHPFDLTSLQLEAYKISKISPKETLSLAQNLYTNGYISYPRTSSHQLPESLGYKKIIEGIAKQDRYNALAKELLAKTLKPNNGNKSDPAHPAIHPTPEIPKNISDREAKIYDLIVHRTLATFASNAVMATVTIDLDVQSEIFIAKGTKTKIPGWHKFYKPYLMLKEKDLPEVKENEILNVNKSELISKETQPPRRYTPASIIKELNKKEIGTKSTRAEIIDNLYQRNYIKNESIEVTDIGLKTIETLEKFCPEIIDEKLTRNFELEMEQIQEKNKAGSEVIEEAKEFLEKTIKHFKKNEKEIGSALADASKETRQKEIFISKCPVCKEGDLQIRKGKYGSFAACNRYEQGCSATFALPKNALLKGTEKLCDVCSYPKILAIRARRKPQELCINPNCESKRQDEEALKKIAEGKTCPNCSSQLVVKAGIYGAFLACPGYPNCKYIENIKKEFKKDA